MTKINPYDLPPEEYRRIRIVLTNIKWAASPGLTLPDKMDIPVDSSLPNEEMVARAMDIASTATGFCIIDCDVEPVDYGDTTEEADSLSDTLDYEGEIYLS